MKHIRVVGRFKQEAELIDFGNELKDKQCITDHPLSVPYLNVASWLLPPSTNTDHVFKDIPAALPIMDFHLQPHIDVHRQEPLLGLAAIVNHITNEWHFRIHKAFEFPFLLADGNDAPKRWRPNVYLGQALQLELPQTNWPSTLCCDRLVLFDQDTHTILSEHKLNETDAIPW